MAYALGVDLGTTYSAAAIAEDGRVETFTLGTVAPAIPSVVLLRADGEVLVGEAAERRSITEPTRTGREFKRRLGDPAPLVLGGTPYGAEALMARLLRAIVDAATERQGGPPERITVTHPANYGPYKKELLVEMARLADAGQVAYLTEPEAAAISYAQQNRLEPGQIVAVYDFGGGTFDAAVLRKTPDGFEILGQPEGMERLGGIDFDQAIFAHVNDAVGGHVSEVDASDPMARAALARLRADIRSAKESLSTDTDVTIPVMLPGLQTDVRLTRPEFEGMIRPRILETISALERAVRSAGIQMEEVDRILLVGGSSRIPLVGEMVRAATGRPVSMDAHPKFAIALGAARAGLAALDEARAAPTTAVPVAAAEAETATSVLGPAADPVAMREPAVPPRAERRRGSPLPFILGGAALVAAAGVAAFLLLGRGDDPGLAADPSATAPTTPTALASGEGPSPTGATSAAPSTTPAPNGGSASGVITTFAGTDTPGNAGDGGPANAAQIERASGVAIGPDGAVYITDYTAGNLRVVRDGTIETLLTDLFAPGGVAVDADGNAYVADTENDLVIKVDAAGNAQTVAGSLDSDGASGDGGPASAALLFDPYDVAVDQDGSVYIADAGNHRVRRIGTDGVIVNVAGTGSSGAGGDGGSATQAQLSSPQAVVVDAEGNLYIGDADNYRVRRVTPDGTIETVAGNGESIVREIAPTGVATDIPVVGVEGLAVDAAGNLFANSSSYILRISPNGDYAVVGGGGDSEDDGIESTDAFFGEVWGLAVDPVAGDLYVATGSRVRVIAGVATPT